MFLGITHILKNKINATAHLGPLDDLMSFSLSLTSYLLLVMILEVSYHTLVPST
jgi:hypothetical protein